MDRVRGIRQRFVNESGASSIFGEQQRKCFDTDGGRIHKLETIAILLVPYSEPKNPVFSWINARQAGSPGWATVGKWG
jgi:hypothetical protein